MREFANQMTRSDQPGDVVVSVVNPGFVNTSVMRNNTSILFKLGFPIMRACLARRADVGARTLIFGAYGGRDTHGKYLDHCEVGRVSPFIVSEEGKAVQKRLWDEFVVKMQGIDSSILAYI